MKKLQPVLIFILAIACIFMYIRKPSGHQQEIERLNKDIKKRERLIDSAYQVIESGSKREQVLRGQYEALERSREEAEQNTNKWRKRYENEKNSRPVPYNDAELDSLLTAWYGR